MLVVTIGTMVATVALYAIVPKGFFPNVDTGAMRAIFEGAQDISFKAFVEKEALMNKIVLDDPAVATVGSFIGGAGGPGGGSPGNQGMMFINLKPVEERKVSIFTVVDRLRRKLSKVEGSPSFHAAKSQDLRVGSAPGQEHLSIHLDGLRFEGVEPLVGRICLPVAKGPPVSRRHQRPAIGRPAGLRLSIDRDAASRLGHQPVPNRQYPI